MTDSLTKKVEFSPEGIVEDFGIKQFIQNNLPRIKDKIREYAANKDTKSMMRFAETFLLLIPNQTQYMRGLHRYQLTNLAPLVPYVLKYINDRISELNGINQNA
jgi:hypothetical protein